jgi:hypothetical protein
MTNKSALCLLGDDGSEIRLYAACGNTGSNPKARKRVSKNREAFPVAEHALPLFLSCDFSDVLCRDSEPILIK